MSYFENIVKEYYMNKYQKKVSRRVKDVMPTIRGTAFDGDYRKTKRLLLKTTKFMKKAGNVGSNPISSQNNKYA